MKKMILAPAVALAFTGLVASPVVAAEQAPAEQPAKTSETATTADATPIEKPEAETPKKTAEPKKTEEPTTEAPKKTEAPKTESPKKTETPETQAPKKTEKTPKKTEESPVAPKATSHGPTKDSTPQAATIEATMTVDPTSITAEDATDPDKGITITISGVKSGDTVTDSLSTKTETVTTDGTYIGKIYYPGDAADLKVGTADFTVTITREGEADKTLNGQFEIADEAPEFDPKASLTPKKLTQSEFTDAKPWTDESKGVTITVTGLLPGDYVHNEDPYSNQYDTVKESDNGQLEYRMYNNSGNPAIVAPGIHKFNITVNRKDENGDLQTKTLPLQYEITPDDAVDTLDPALTVIPEEITAEDMADKEKGFEIRVSGVKAGDKVTDSLLNKTETVEKDGTYSSFAYWEGDPSELEEGPVDFTVTVQRGEGETMQEEVLDGTITIVADGQTATPTIKVDDKQFTVSEFKDSGITITGEGMTPGGTVTLIGGTAQAPFDLIEVTADEDGKVVGHLASPKDGLEPGKYSVWAYDQKSETLSNKVAITIDEDEAPAEASLTVTPKKLEAGDFVNEKKGVTLTVKDCEPGEDVRFQVNPKGLNVTAYDRTVKADENGGASVSVYGTSTDSSAYVGDYTVTATCGDDVLTDAFSVTPAAKGGSDDGNDDKGNGSNDDDTTTADPGSELPRTGADLGGLTAGALLLLVGGAVVTLTGRRKKMSSDPSEL